MNFILIKVNIWIVIVSGNIFFIIVKVEQQGEWIYYEVIYIVNMDIDIVNCVFYMINKISNELFYDDLILIMMML